MMKWFREMLQNLQYSKIRFYFHFEQLWIFNCEGKNILYGFFIPKIGQTILSDLLDNFIKYKPHISEVCMHRYRYVRPHSLIKSKNLDLESCFQLRMSTKFGIIFDIIEYTICHHIIVPMTLILWIFEYGPGWQIGINFLIGRFPVYYIFLKKKSEVDIYTNCWTKSLRLENWIHRLKLNIFIVKNNYLGIYFSFSAGVIV